MKRWRAAALAAAIGLLAGGAAPAGDLRFGGGVSVGIVTDGLSARIGDGDHRFDRRWESRGLHGLHRGSHDHGRIHPRHGRPPWFAHRDRRDNRFRRPERPDGPLDAGRFRYGPAYVLPSWRREQLDAPGHRHGRAAERRGRPVVVEGWDGRPARGIYYPGSGRVVLID